MADQQIEIDVNLTLIENIDPEEIDTPTALDLSIYPNHFNFFGNNEAAELAKNPAEMTSPLEKIDIPISPIRS